MKTEPLYIDKTGALTDKFYADRANDAVQVAEEAAEYAAAIVDILGSVYDPKAMKPEDARSNNVELRLNQEKLNLKQFRELWEHIRPKTAYAVDFDTAELTRKAIDALNRKLRVAKIFFIVDIGEMESIGSKEELATGASFTKKKTAAHDAKRLITAGRGLKYDLIGKLCEETGLIRKTIVDILTGIEPKVFDQFKENPEEFITRAAALINEEKATVIVQHITYNMLEEKYDADIFTEPTIKGRLGVNAMKTERHLYDHLVYDSEKERTFAGDLDASTEVAVYVKLPDRFHIATPVGNYTPDWAIAFYEGQVKHIYFVAETKGSLSSLQLREVERLKIHCAREHFKAIGKGQVVYDVVDSYEKLLDLVH